MESLQVALMLETSLSAQERVAWDKISSSLLMASQLEGIGALEVTVVGVDDQTMWNLNARYRAVNNSTDVLSFPQWTPDEIRTLSAGLPLGDIVISLPRAREQAVAFGHSLTRELSFLAVHGFLHLLGYDHHTPATAAKMEEQQCAVLTAVGLGRGEA